MPKYLLTLFACALATLALAACGGDSESDEEQITKAIETSVETTDPDDCGVYATQAFLEQSEGERGEAAVASCEEDIEDTSNDPDSIAVSKIDVGGEAATAEVAFRGGALDKQTLVVSLVEEDGDWKLDQIESFAVFDRNALVGQLEAGFEQADLNAGQLSCVHEALKFASYEDLEAVVLSVDGQTALAELVADC